MSIRTRWAAIGAAVAVTLGAGGGSLGQAAIGSGDKPVFVAIEPCRLVDTRPGDNNVGSRDTPLGAGEPPWVRWRLGLLVSNPGRGGLLGSVERRFELCW